ncbi:DNA repair protein RecO [Patescibacteria group bacterium]|nr:DNA repair protein RecO [Patescibacteria group bacterium]
MSTYLTSAFVIKMRPFKERDRLYTILTEKQGKINLLATGSQKIISKMAGHLWPGHKIYLMGAHGKQFDHLASVRLEEIYLKPPYYLPSLILSQTLLELVDIFTEPGQSDPYLLELLEKYFKLISYLPKQVKLWRPAAKELLAGYILHLLKHQGLAVALSRCDKCKKELVNPVVYNWVQHGFYHQSCLSKGEKNVLLSVSGLQGLVSRNNSNFEDKAAAGILPFLVNYISGQVGREIATLKVLRNLLRYET